MKDLAGRTAFITGGANGIGYGLAQALLQEGCKVAIADISQQALADAINNLNSDNAMAISLDVASREDFAHAADTVEDKLGPVSLVFNNAGVNLFTAIEDSSFDDWDWLLGVNLHGVINGVMTFSKRMIARGEPGHIVNTTSMASFIASPIPGIYNTTKFAVRGLSESLRYSLAEHNIGVSLLCPGLVDSHINCSEEVRPQSLSRRGGPVNEEFDEMLANMQRQGMAPAEVARKTIAAIRQNRYYIFPHPEFRDELGEIFDGIINAMPVSESIPEGRMAIEASRRERTRAIRNRALQQDWQ